MKRVLLIFTVLCATNGLFAQMTRGDFNQQFLEANQLMEEKLWNQSIDIWLQLYTLDNTNANINHKLGYCYLQTSNEKLKSLSYLKAANQGDYAKKYDPYDPAETRAPVEALYYLGRAYHINYELDQAIETFNNLESKVATKHRLADDAKRQKEMCEEAKKQLADPQNFVITNVGDIINDATNEYSPVISLDESALFYTSRRIRPDSSNSELSDFDTGEYKEDIYVSYKDREGNWMIPELLEFSSDDTEDDEESINFDNHAATINVSPDGQILYIYYDEGGNGQIYESTLVGESWTEPVLLGSDINTDSWETHVTVSADGNTLFFVSDREGGYGGRDIYRCVKLPTGEWSKALNVGPSLNTEWEEDSPFLSADGKTLYFASTGHRSMGGFDIFYSTLGTDEEWSEPEPIGYPLNTVDDDVFFVPTADQKRAYYSSRKEEGFGLKDIYVVDLPDTPVESDLAVLKGYILAAEGEDLPADTYVLVTNRKTGDVTEYRPRQRDGAYVAILPPCIDYQIEYIVDREIVHEEFVQVPCESSYREIEKEIYLLPVSLDGEKVIVVDKTKDPDIVIVDTPDPDPEPEPEVIVPDTFDPDNPIDVVVTKNDAYYERYFVYDFHEFGMEESLFNEFIEGVSAIIDSKGKATIIVESSASNVPSSRFQNNVELTGWRNKTATDQIIVALGAEGYKEGEHYSFGKPNELVQGPEYVNDAWRKDKYEPWQYIKVWAE